MPTVNMRISFVFIFFKGFESGGCIIHSKRLEKFFMNYFIKTFVGLLLRDGIINTVQHILISVQFAGGRSNINLVEPGNNLVKWHVVFHH